MNCLACKTKLCKSDAKDCSGLRDDALNFYSSDLNRSIYLDADSLVKNGRAGTLSRLEEIAEFCSAHKIKTAGIAYCYSMENLAAETSAYLVSKNIKVNSYRCTIGGIRENEIDASMGQSVNCNPAGQAETINREGVDLVVEMGLCLGHDILFHQALKVPHTVFIVKDRVHRHNPARALASYRDSADEFIASLDSSFNMRSADWLSEHLSSENLPLVIDLRAEEAYNTARINGSVNILLKELPEKFQALAEFREREIICVCNGSVQSAYAVSYLFSRGFKKVFNLSGGFSGFQNKHASRIIFKNSLPV